jgi:lysophospholipase L1-like esterase
MTWATARLRRIRIELPANIGPRGVWTKTANDSVVPAPAAGPTFFALGDSWTEGVGSDPTVGLRFPKALELFIGKEFYLGGQGGTGYVNQGSGVSSEFGSAARLNAVADAQPDYLIVAGTSNDDGNAASVQAAAAALYAQVAIRSPKTKIIVLGPQNTSTSVSAQREAVRAAVIAAATAAPNVVLIIDPIAEQWITGSGTTSAPGTAGNASVFVGGTTGSDGAHLNAAGYDYWAARVAARLNALVSA